MTQALSEQSVTCPYCGEAFASLIDVSALDSEYIEDCQVCCRPILFAPRLDGAGEVRVEVRREDETS